MPRSPARPSCSAAPPPPSAPRPNSQVSPVDAGMPGMLPVVNGWCVEQAVRTGLGLKAEINRVSVFERKNYFYPDLPQGYQISQYQHPIVGKGKLDDRLAGRHRQATSASPGCISSMDAGKSLHDQPRRRKPDRPQPLGRGADGDRLRARHPHRPRRPSSTCASCARSCAISAPATATWRRARCAATPTSRCASSGDRRSARAARSRTSTRCASSPGRSSTRRKRQIEILEGGGRIDQETRLFDSAKGETRSMRSKEEAHDYRYFPDPDLLPLELADGFVERIAGGLPELPDDKKARFVRDYGLSALRCRRARRRGRHGRLFRAGRQGSRRQAGRELGGQRPVRPARQGRQGDRGQPGARRRTWASCST